MARLQLDVPNRLLHGIVVALLLTTGAGCSAGTRFFSDVNDRPAISAGDIEARIDELINRERVAAGLRRLAQDSALAAVAREHSRDMAVRNYFDHTDPVHGSPTDRAAAAGYVCEKREGDVLFSGVAENIAMQHSYSRYTVRDGVRSYDWSSTEEIAEAVVTGWMQSPGHRANIVDPRSDRHGVGVHIRDHRVLVTQKLC